MNSSESSAEGGSPPSCEPKHEVIARAAIRTGLRLDDDDEKPPADDPEDAELRETSQMSPLLRTPSTGLRSPSGVAGLLILPDNGNLGGTLP